MKKALNIAAAVLLAAAGVGLLVFIAHLNNASQRDFIEYWSAGQLLSHRENPYDIAATLALERGAGYTGSFPQITYSPPLALFVALPLGLVSANAGLICWMVLLLASLIVSLRLLWTLQGRPKNSLHLLGYCFAPVMACLMFGQLGLFLLIGIVLFLYYLDSRPFVSGAALLLCALKPHLFMPFAVALLLWMIGRRAWRTLAGFSTSLLGSCALTLYLDPHVWSQYSEMMRTSLVLQSWVPTLAATLRFLIDRRAVCADKPLRAHLEGVKDADGVVSVVAADGGTLGDFVAGGDEGLAHLGGHGGGELFAVGFEERGESAHPEDALVERFFGIGPGST